MTAHLIVSFQRWNGKSHVLEKGIVVTWDATDTIERYPKAIIVCDSDHAIVSESINGLKAEGWRTTMGIGI